MLRRRRHRSRSRSRFVLFFEHGYHLGLRHNMLITRRLSQVTRINKGNLLCIMFCIRHKKISTSKEMG
ncbi:hypothetical protein ZEAMMB73_Zm00001d016238 [Zea mays]|uniref:Uncharacterized protein n=1 Tax=Zea mays TaxID=4577 RepID=A0A1D6H6D4_MAIZE|nr:hypothetical protein ZEAMMB73_Zm00001d016238 [Zea mays]